MARKKSNIYGHCRCHGRPVGENALKAEDMKPRPRCQAASDGECNWQQCPQLRDGEPEKSGRHCPLDYDEEGRSLCYRCGAPDDECEC